MTYPRKIPRRPKLPSGTRRVSVMAAVSPELQAAIAERADEAGTSIAAVTAEVLEREFGVPA